MMIEEKDNTPQEVSEENELRSAEDNESKSPQSTANWSKEDEESKPTNTDWAKEDEESKPPKEFTKEETKEEIKGQTPQAVNETKIKMSTGSEDLPTAPNSPERKTQHAATDAPGHKTHVVIGEYDISVPDDKVPLLGIMAASIILLIAVFLQNVYERESEHGKYGVAVGVVAFCAAFVSLVLPNKLFIVTVINNFLFVWSFIAACVLTFGNGPFTATGNGYFSLWAMVVMSALVSDAPGRGRRARSVSDKLNAIMGMGAASLVVLIALGFEFRTNVTDSSYTGEAIYGIIIAISSLLLSFFFTFMQCWRGRSRNCCERPILTAYAVMWIVAAAAMTFGGPFLNTGNGYFASWIAAIVSVKAASLCWAQSEQ